jgi:hypothetical protein
MSTQDHQDALVPKYAPNPSLEIRGLRLTVK